MSGQWFFAVVQIFLSVIPALIYLVAAWLILRDVPVTAGTIVAFTTVQARLTFPLMGLLRVALDLQTSGALFARIFEYLDLRPAITDGGRLRDGRRGRSSAASSSTTSSSPTPTPSRGSGTLRGVSFDIEPGQFAAFVGPSGAGKTTVSYLIPRFYEATGGSVRFAGHRRPRPAAGVAGREHRHRQPGDVPVPRDDRRQPPLRAAGRHRRAARRRRAGRRTSTRPIASFPDGYDTVVGERGYRLSGGEKQRIAIARVLLKDPAVLVLDEATSALDTVSERVVQEALDTAARGRTTIAIAHRLSTVRHADVIFVVDGGRIVERGTHDELLARGGVYADLYGQQVASTT